MTAETLQRAGDAYRKLQQDLLFAKTKIEGVQILELGISEPILCPTLSKTLALTARGPLKSTLFQLTNPEGQD